MGRCFSKFNRTAFMAAFATGMVIMTLGMAPPVFAANPADQSIFEIGPGQTCDEGGLTNILGDTTSCSSGTPSAGPDWADLFVVNPDGTIGTSNLYGGAVARFIRDQPGNVADQTTYTSQGSDTNSQHPTDWTWTTASVPSKDDITNAYVYEKIVNGHRMLYVGAEREAPNGDSHIDFEFFQNNIGLDHAAPCPANTVCKFTGTNKDGDLLISMDFTNGGDFAGLSIRVRHEGVKSTQVNTPLGKIATGDNYDLIGVVPAGCNFAVGGVNTVCAFSNSGTINGGPWVNLDAQGNEIFSLPKNAFTEWGIDITALGLTSACFPSVLVKTRSSQSITAQLKDFSLRDFESCQAAVSTNIHNTSHVNITGSTVVGGTTVHDKATITGSVTGGTPGGSVTFYRWDNNTCSGTPANTYDPVGVSDGGSVSGNPTAVAESPTYVTQPGQSISFFASYSGDGLYPAVPLPTTVSAADCEPLNVTTLGTLVSTTIRQDDANGVVLLNTAVDTSGGTVNAVDVATVTAQIPAGVTNPPPLGEGCTGTPAEGTFGSVTFSKYTTGDCTGTAVKETVCVAATSFSSGVPQGNGGTATASALSSQEQLSGSEFLCFQAKYAGNDAYDLSASSKNEPLCAFPQVP